MIEYPFHTIDEYTDPEPIYIYDHSPNSSAFNPPINSTQVELHNIDFKTWSLIKPKLPKTTQHLEFFNSVIEDLIIPQGISWIFAGHTGITTIHLPDSTLHASLIGNSLVDCEIPHNIESLNLRDNKLKTIHVRPGGHLLKLNDLDVKNNPSLKLLDFDPPLHVKLLVTCESSIEFADTLKVSSVERWKGIW
jgi:hypothetical protein